MNSPILVRRAAIAAALVVACVVLARGADAPRASYPIQPAPLASVRFTDEFWRPRLERNRTVTIQHILRQNELTGRVANFARAAKKAPGGFEGKRYNDTDVYKVIEAAAYTLVSSPNPALEQRLDELIALIAAAQEPDGYVYTARTVDPATPAPGAGPARWSSLHTSHELYNAGHMYEAAVAHFEATGKRTLLDVAVKNANLVCEVFGPGKRLDAPGHQEIELALVKLWRATGDFRYLAQARFFLDQRGRPHTVPPPAFGPRDPFNIYNDLEYRQDHVPVARQTRVVGHSVRATYMLAGMTDVATLWPDADWARTLDAAWQDVASKRMYLSGGLGSKGETEAFGDDYVLPNSKAYTETCASIGGMLWYHRMFLRTGDAKYSRCLRAHALQRVPVRGVAGRRHVLLPEPARVRRQDGAQRVLRGGVLPRQPRAPDGAVAVACLRTAFRRSPGHPLRRQRGRPQDRRHAGADHAADEVPVGGARRGCGDPGSPRRVHTRPSRPRLGARPGGADGSLPLRGSNGRHGVRERQRCPEPGAGV